MKRRPLWRLSVVTTQEAEEAVAELLSRSLNAAPASYLDLETGRVRVEAYLDSIPSDDRRWRKRLRDGVARIPAYGLSAGPCTVSVKRLYRQDWAESWKRHFRPFEVGRTLLVKPPWSRRRPRAGQAVVMLNPGLSFGTGHHPTTAFCLEQLVAERHPGEPQSCLDVGTGSGILSIAAAKLGYSQIRAIDNDPEAISVALLNARKNGVERAIQFNQSDAAEMSLRPRRRFSVVCGNLAASLLLRERKRLAAQAASRGLLVLSGILKEEFPKVCVAYESLGLVLLTTQAQREWQSGAFRKS